MPPPDWAPNSYFQLSFTQLHYPPGMVLAERMPKPPPPHGALDLTQDSKLLLDPSNQAIMDEILVSFAHECMMTLAVLPLLTHERCSRCRASQHGCACMYVALTHSRGLPHEIFSCLCAELCPHGCHLPCAYVEGCIPPSGPAARRAAVPARALQVGSGVHQSACTQGGETAASYIHMHAFMEHGMHFQWSAPQAHHKLR